VELIKVLKSLYLVELEKESVSSKMEHTAEDCKIYKTMFYNLDELIYNCGKE